MISTASLASFAERYQNLANQSKSPPRPTSLVTSPVILPQFYQDVVLCKIKSVITKRCIRHPIADREGNLYEKAEIEKWLSLFPISPVTAKPLSPSQLVAKPALEALINHRLKALDTLCNLYRVASKAAVHFIDVLCGVIS